MIAIGLSNYLSTGSCLSQLLCGPSVSRRPCYTNVDHSARFEFDDEERKEGAKKQIGHLQEIAGPHVFCVIAQERRPVLSSRSRDANMSHIFLNGPLTHANTQLEQLTTDTFRSPEPIQRGHFLDQRNSLFGYLWFGRCCSGFVLPEELKSMTMPPQERLWLDNEQRLLPCTRSSSEKD